MMKIAKEMNQKIEKLLFELGIYPDVKGFYYLVFAINQIIENPLIKIGIIEYYIAKEYDVSVCSVERAMRFSINKVDLDNRIYHEYELNKKPTISLFVSILAHKVKGDIENEEI